MGLRVGFAQCDITPALGLPLGGYGARAGGAAGVLDPLCCRAVALDEGETAAALAVLDLVHVSGEWVARVRDRAVQRLALPAPHLLVAATHTHSGPAVFRSALSADPRIGRYEDELVDRVVDCVAAAQRAAGAALLRTGAATAPGIAANRRDVGEPVDDRVRVLCAHAPDGRLLGVVANFACHPTVLPAANLAYSADLFGAAAAQATGALGVPVVLTNGAAGDVSTRFTRRAQTHAEVQRLGCSLAAAICTAAWAAVPIDASPIAAGVRAVPVCWRALPAPAEAQAELQAARAALEQARAAACPPHRVRLAESRVEGAQAALWVSVHGGWEAVFGARHPVASVQAIRCGSWLLLAVPGELFTRSAAWLRQALGDGTLIVGYANDYLGYFVPPDAAPGYEALIAMVDPACEAAIRQGLAEAATVTQRRSPAPCTPNPAR
jgi:hypothetical protein